ncbi:MAG TPA: HIRAN domain-containing protein [Actinomycetota bacterium]|nr:HIRAN domain-containing protein [Actinomycetota bacterium]
MTKSGLMPPGASVTAEPPGVVALKTGFDLYMERLRGVTELRFLDRLLRGKRPEEGVGRALESAENDAPRPRYEIVDARDESTLPPNVVLLGGQGRVEVKGESNYQDALDAICGGKCEAGHGRKVLAVLQPEPENPYDSNAIAIHVDGKLVGYMPKQAAAEYAPIAQLLASKGKVGAGRAFIKGGWRRADGDEGEYGIELELSPTEKLLKTRKITSLE